MPSHGTAVLADGKIALPEQALKSKHWTDGSRVSVIETPDGILLLDLTPPRESLSHMSFEELLAANKVRLGLQPEAENWRALQGILSDDLLDSLEEKHRLRDEEQAHDARKFEG